MPRHCLLLTAAMAAIERPEIVRVIKNRDCRVRNEKSAWAAVGVFQRNFSRTQSKSFFFNGKCSRRLLIRYKIRGYGGRQCAIVPPVVDPMRATRTTGTRLRFVREIPGRNDRSRNPLPGNK